MRRRTAVLDPQEPERHSTPAIVEGETVEVPVDAIVFDEFMFQSRSEITFCRDRWYALRHYGDRDYIPFVFPRPDGTYAVTSFMPA